MQKKRNFIKKTMKRARIYEKTRYITSIEKNKKNKGARNVKKKKRC